MNQRTGILIAAVLAATLAGCGGSAAPPPTSTSPAQASPVASVSAAAKPAASGSAPASTRAAQAAAGGIALTVAYSQATAGFGPLYVAKDTGMFQKNGLEVTLKRVTGTSQLPALVANEIQIGAMGGTEVINANVGGANVVMLAVVDDFPTFSLYANKKFKAVTELSGESIGITTAGSSTDATAQMFLKHYNMTGKVSIVPAGGTIPAILAAMSKGLSAGMISPPVNVEAERQGFVELVNGFKLGEPLNTAGYTVTRAWLKDHQDVVEKFLKSYAEAWAYTAGPAHKAELVKIIQKYTESDEEGAVSGYEALLPVWQGKKAPTVDPRGLANIAALSNDPKVAQAKTADFIDNGLLEASAK